MGKRKVVFVIRDRNDSSLPAMFSTEGRRSFRPLARRQGHGGQTPTKRALGVVCMLVSKRSRLITKGLIASMAFAPLCEGFF
jgi:hypothetical protein